MQLIARPAVLCVGPEQDVKRLIRRQKRQPKFLKISKGRWTSFRPFLCLDILMMKTQSVDQPENAEREPSSFRSQMTPLLFLAGIFLLNFLSRIILAPLMPTVEKNLNIGHGEAGSLFFIISLGYCPMLLGSGFVSSRLNHRRTIILSSLAVGGAFLFVGFSHSLWGVRLGLLILGMAAGLYLPSGILTIIGLVRPKDLGKSIAIHELAPNLGFLIAPLLAEALLGWFSWRGVLIFIGMASILGGVVFAFWGKGGNTYGEAPNLGMMRGLLVDPSVLIMIVLFTLALGMSSGVYSMMPLYLVSERGMDRTWANTLVGLSRVATLGIVLLSGWMTDRLGVKKNLKAVFLAAGLLTSMLGVTPGSWVIPIVFIQGMLATCFFPVGFAALSRVGSPNVKNGVLALTLPVASLLGGAIPVGIGLMGEMGFFSLGFTLLGGLILGGLILIRYLKLND
jgi:NNP family nitrate/nitrite transporter-like MFS transporter